MCDPAPTPVADQSSILLDAPGLADELHGERLERAISDCVARTLEVPRGKGKPASSPDGIRLRLGLLVLGGLLVRRVAVAGRAGAAVLGPGDLLSPRPQEGDGKLLPQTESWRALAPSRLAVLDEDFTSCVAPYPEVLSALAARLLRRSRHAAMSIAIVHHPRIEARVKMLFWDLAERWGRLRGDGVHVPLKLTHGLIADLIAAQRPSVTMALGELAARAVAIPTEDGWLVAGKTSLERDALLV